MIVSFLSFTVIILSVNVVSVHNFLLWGNWNADAVEEVTEDLEMEEAAAEEAVEGVEENVEYAADQVQSGTSSFYGILQGKLQDIRANMQNLFDHDGSHDISDFMTPISQQLSVLQDMVAGWAERAQNLAQSEWEFRKPYLMAAKEDLKNTMKAWELGDYDAALDNFKSAMENVRDESAIYRALQYAWDVDNSMIPMVSNLSATLLQNLEYDLSSET